MRVAKLLILPLTLMVNFSVSGQESIKSLLSSIEANNPTIAALKAQLDFEKAEARTEMLPPNPEIEGGRFPAMDGAGVKYAWGVSQSFEFPTVYSKRSQLAKTADKFASANFLASRQEVLLNAQGTILELIHSKRQLSELKARKALAQNTLLVVSKLVDAGQGTAMDLNNAKLRLAEVSQSIMELEGNIGLLNHRLFVLNGNKSLECNDTLLLVNQLPTRDELYGKFTSSDPRIAALEGMVEQSQAQLKLVKHQSLPELSIGFESEKTDAEHFTGFRAGISIPLWGNMGKRRAATAHHSAKQLEQQSERMMLDAHFEQLYLKALNYQVRLETLKQASNDYSNIALTQKALQAGQISVIDFFNEVTFLYSVTDRLLELELEYAMLYAELHRFEL